MKLQGRNLTNGTRGEDVRQLHQELRLLGFLHIPDSETKADHFGPHTMMAVRELQERSGLPVTGAVDEATARRLQEQIDRLSATDDPGVRLVGTEETAFYTVQGKVTSPDRAGVVGLRVVIVDRNVRRDTELAEAVTNARGEYTARFEATRVRELGKEKPDLQARVYAGKEILVGSSDVRYDASERETLHVRLPARAEGLSSEHETLTGALARHFDGRLGELEENEKRQDVSYLAHKAGWDARAVAMASLADRHAADTEIPAPFYYALFRAGLPADPGVLYRADPRTVRNVWKRAIEQDVIPRQLEEAIRPAEERFRTLAAAHALDAPAPSGTSSLREVVNLTLRNDPNGQQLFAELYTAHRGDRPKFWQEVEGRFGRETTERLRLDGQLGYLTLHNAPLIEQLHRSEELRSPLDLVRRGYHDARSWERLLEDAPVPQDIPGTTAAEKRERYSELLASQVRLSFPTAVVAEKIRGGEVRLGGDRRVEAEVADFLDRNQGDFEIGVHPIGRFLARNGLEGQVSEPAKRQIQRLQRVYQITPDDASMSVLLESGLDAAYHIVRHDEPELVARLGGKLGAETVRLIHAKAKQVHATVLNVAMSYLLARDAPALAVNAEEPQPEAASDVLAIPTLETLFGSMDFCACDHCKSILGPAAYLVDLLQFIDRPDEAENPQTVLLERRPDIEHLPLTCENTNTPLPYIDVVNETLEYFITHNLSMTGYAGHDTGAGVEAADLLANPQYVDDTAYGVLAGALFPPPLPFHRPLEALRRTFEAREIRLADAMAVLRTNDGVERPDPDPESDGYGWRDILMETLRFSRAEYRLLTDRTLSLGDILGFAPGTPEETVLEELSHAKAFSRRVGITYDDLVALLGTRFVNPSIELIPLLEPLGVPFATLAELEAGTITDEDFLALLPPGLDPAPYGGDVVAWIKDAGRYARILGLIVLTDPTADPTDAGSEKLCNFDAYEFRTANPDNGANALRAIDFVRLLRFLRLWKKLGLTVDQTDRLITALYPPEQQPVGDADDLERLDAGFLVLLPRIGAVFQAMDRLKLTAKKDLAALLACQAPGGNPEWLARKLRLSVQELELLSAVTGLDPSAPLDPPDPPLLRLARLVDELRAASLKTVQALYLLWNEDVSGRSVPEERLITDLARALRTGFAAVESELAVPEAPDAPTARARMAQVYGGADTDLFFGLLEGTLRLEVPYDHSAEALEEAIAEAGGGRLGYDDFRKRLLWSGVLSTAQRDAIQSAAGVTAAFKDAMDDLYAASQAVVGPFFARNPELEPLYLAYTASAEPPETRRRDLLLALLPNLRVRRKRQQALAEASAALRSDLGFAQAILDDAAVLHAAADLERPGLDDLTALEAPGDVTALAAGAWQGYLEAPENGFYKIALETTAPAAVTLTLGGGAVALEQDGKVWTNQDPIELTAGALVAVTITVAAPAGLAAVRWQTAGRGWEGIPGRHLYAGAVVDRLRSTALRFLKAASLAAALKLTAGEMAWLSTRPEHAIGGRSWLSALPVSGSPGAAVSEALRDVLFDLLAFSRLKARRSPKDERLLAVLRQPAAVLADGTSPLLVLTGWESASLAALLGRFGLTVADLSTVSAFRRVDEAYALVKKLGTAASTLLEAATNEPGADTVRDLQAELAALYDPSDWLAVIQPVNDALRALRRDALVAHILWRLRESGETRHIDTPDKLFEFFLMDVQMEPCMQTSRIRHALSSVQLFIERCLMNLEPRVEPSAIRARQWEWMKRYRVWEANRKVFLWPENWLEPELRDDQSPIFKETLSGLLQGDITEDRAALALLDYLAKLGEVAKLEPCGIHCDEREAGTNDDVIHVVARTPGAHRKYFHRRRDGDSWSPWLPIQLDIEDNPVIPVVWRSRLFLFWLRLLKQSPVDPNAMPTGSTTSDSMTDLSLTEVKTDAKSGAKANAKVTVQAVLCWSEFFNGKWQPIRTSEVDRPAELGKFGPNAFDRSKLRLHVSEEGSGETNALRITIGGASGSFVLYNTHSAPVVQDASKSGGLDVIQLESFFESRTLETSGDTLTVEYYRGALHIADLNNPDEKKRPVLKTGLADRTVEPRHPLQNTWDAPFFYEDGRHVFYVTTRERTVRIPQYDGFWELPDYTVHTPDLVFEQPPLAYPPKGDPWVVRPGVDLVDPVQAGRFVSEDVNIHQGLGTSASFDFGGQKIGPAGLLSKSLQG